MSHYQNKKAKKYVIAMLLVIVALAIATGSTWAGEYENCVKVAHNKSICKEAVAGDKMAAEAITLLCLEKENATCTAKWAKKAADLGSAVGMFVYGQSVVLGARTALDQAKGFTYIEKAAQAGHPLAQKALGDMYSDGIGTPSSSKDAALWYKKSADKGIAEAAFEYAELLYLGTGVPENKPEAF